MNALHVPDMIRTSFSGVPILALVLTMSAYLVAQVIHRWSNRNPFANPVLIAVVLVVAFLFLSGVPYETYFDDAHLIHMLLGPATVSLALPLYRHWSKLREAIIPLTAGLFAGSLTAMISVIAIAVAFGLPHEIIASLAPKSATTPIAMAVATEVGGVASLTAVFVICTGIFGAVFGPWILDALRIDDRSKGFALGVASHGIGTARAFQLGDGVGACAALGMGINGILTALLVPVVLPLLLNVLNR